MKNQQAIDQKAKTIHVLFVEYGISFGGAIISASELINGLTKNYPVKTSLLSNMPPEAIEHLFDQTKIRPFSRPINYKTRFKVENLTHKLKKIPIASLILAKSYALVDSLAKLMYAIRIFHYIKKNKVDILHINNGPELDGVLAASWSKIPCIVHCRGLSPTAAEDRISSTTNNAVDQFIAISEAVRKNLIARGATKEKIHVIHNPADLSKYLSGKGNRDAIRRMWGITEKELVVSIFGRITAWKGQLEFLHAIRTIIEEFPNLKVLLVGDSSDDIHGYQEDVKSLAICPTLKDKVIFTGYQPKVEDYYWASDIVVHNSIEPEPFGRVVIEAMACSRPVIAANEGGPLEIISNGHDGILVEPRNTQSLADALKNLLRSAERRVSLADAAATTVSNKFNRDFIAAKVWLIYKRLLSQHRPKKQA